MSNENRIENQDQDVNASETETRTARRRFLKAGAAVVPVVITLQSGTAWAQSLTCAEKQYFPIVSGDDDDSEVLEELIEAAGYSDDQAEMMVRYFNSETYNGSTAHNIYLKAHAYSCWSSLYPNHGGYGGGSHDDDDDD